MKSFRALLAFVLLLLPAISHAKVLVYRGTLTVVSAAPAQSTLPSLINFYLLVDPDAQKSTNLAYYIKDGKKHQFASLSSTSTYFISAPAHQGKTITALTFGDSATFTDAQNFTLTAIVLYGTNSTLRFATTGSTQLVNYPLHLKGLEQSLNSNSGSSSLAIVRLDLIYQPTDSIPVNDAGTSLEDAIKAISDKLAAKGYKVST